MYVARHPQGPSNTSSARLTSCTAIGPPCDVAQVTVGKVTTYNVSMGHSMAGRSKSTLAQAIFGHSIRIRTTMTSMPPSRNGLQIAGCPTMTLQKAALSWFKAKIRVRWRHAVGLQSFSIVLITAQGENLIRMWSKSISQLRRGTKTLTSNLSSIAPKPFPLNIYFHYCYDYSQGLGFSRLPTWTLCRSCQKLAFLGRLASPWLPYSYGYFVKQLLTGEIKEIWVPKVYKINIKKVAFLKC